MMKRCVLTVRSRRTELDQFTGICPPAAGYVRIACALYAFVIALYSPAQCVLFYFFG
jgi:hypothetical protein